MKPDVLRVSANDTYGPTRSNRVLSTKCVSLSKGGALWAAKGAEEHTPSPATRFVTVPCCWHLADGQVGSQGGFALRKPPTQEVLGGLFPVLARSACFAVIRGNGNVST